jgi:superfamily II DNA/RNA helicase
MCSNGVVITSIHFASRRAADIKAVQWDLAVIDEAHKLRNAYRQSNRMGQNIRWALEERRKLLLTATPLQNSLLELYGLSCIIDDYIFGDLPSFRTRYTGANGDLDELRERLGTFCTRTLRRQVVEYIQYTDRKLITRPFQPSDLEHKLYDAVSAFLQRDDTYSLPQRQRHLTTLIVRKLLASSSRAVAGTLEAMRDRLIDLRKGKKAETDLAEQIISEEDIEEELLDEILENGESAEEEEQPNSEEPQVDPLKLEAEIAELETYIRWAHSVGVDTKARALLKALSIGFTKMKEMGAAQKAIVFTESRRTQQYVKDFLEANGYAGQVVTFSGSNKDPETAAIYEHWFAANKDSGRASGSKQVDVRTAILDNFRDQANIMIATEAAAEGINLQFCSLVVNFDLPWNPQRIEQRIGRCHRYGQKHDVVVINFLNERNEADRRVYELLTDKFNLFNGVFGVSDDVLGNLESGVDFERRVLDIYQTCRTPQQIDTAFKKLRSELDEQIQTKMADTRQALLENFDEDVHSRLRANLEGTQQQLDRIGRMFWCLTKFMLQDHATFDDQEYAFDLNQPPLETVRAGRYHFISKYLLNEPGEFLYRLSHPLAEHVIETAKEFATPLAKVEFDISNHPKRISMVEELRGRSGWLILQRLAIESFEHEEYLLFSAFDDEGRTLDQETCEKLFNCQGRETAHKRLDANIQERLVQEADRHAKATVSRSLEENNRHFSEAREKLEKWADDQVLAAERELKDVKEEIKVLNRQARLAATLEEQHRLQEKIRELEKKKRRQRQRIFDVEDEIINKRDSLISALERRMAQKTTREPLFTIRWSVI